MDKILLFSSIRMVMRADKICREGGVEVKIMPVPHTHSTECGMSLVISENDLDKAKILLKDITFEVLT